MNVCTFPPHRAALEAYGLRENPSIKARLKPRSGITEDLVTDTCCALLRGVSRGQKTPKILRNFLLLHWVTGQKMRRNEDSRWKYHYQLPRGEAYKWKDSRIEAAWEDAQQRGGFVWCDWDGRAEAPVNTSGMNSTPGMAPLSPGLSSSPPLAPKHTNLQSLGSLSGGRFSPSLAKGTCPQVRQGSSPLNSPCPSIMSSPKLWHKASVSRLAEEFFWIGGSVVAQPKWRLGQMGKIHSWHKSEPSQTHHAHFSEST